MCLDADRTKSREPWCTYPSLRKWNYPICHHRNSRLSLTLANGDGQMVKKAINVQSQITENPGGGHGQGHELDVDGDLIEDASLETDGIIGLATSLYYHSPPCIGTIPGKQP